jgi:hypothetical protein
MDIVKQVDSLQKMIGKLTAHDVTSMVSGGWFADNETWVYVSSTSFKVVGRDVTLKYPVGTKVKWNDGSLKYAYVISTAFGTDTTVTICAGSDYAVVNATITANYYSYSAAVSGFPQWFNWTPTLTGFSADPTNCVNRFQIKGRTVTFTIRQVTNGTSNATTMKFSLPVTPATITNQIWLFPIVYTDNSVAATVFGRGIIASGDVTMACGINAGTSDGFTNSGGKRAASIDGFYEI